jgi:signal-transduction protein with cAMP-binding, CBS, and nucleotidyltransferase domain
VSLDPDQSDDAAAGEPCAGDACVLRVPGKGRATESSRLGMKIPIRRPEEILAFRSLAEILGPNVRQIWSVAPSDSARTAVELMAAKDIGLVVVTEGDALTGVLSERDCIRRVAGISGSLEQTPVSQIMVREIVAVGFEHTFADCLRLMHAHRIRHLPVMRGSRLAAVISVRDLLSEAVEHHRKIIGELERERMTIFTSMA